MYAGEFSLPAIIANLPSELHSSWLLALNHNEHINIPDLLSLAAEQNKDKNHTYLLPVFFPSKLFYTCAYQPRFFTCTSDLKKLKIRPEAVHLYESPTENKLAAFLENTALSEKENTALKLSHASLLALNSFEGLALRKYKELSGTHLDDIAAVNFYLTALEIGEAEEAEKIQASCTTSDSILVNYLRFINSENPSEKKAYCLKILKSEFTGLLYEPDIKKIFKTAVMYLSEKAENDTEKMGYLKLAYFYNPDTIDADAIFEYTLTAHKVKEPEISVVIPTFENFRDLEQTLKTLVINTDISLEIIIVEDGGIITAEAEAFYDRYKEYIKVLRNNFNYGFIKSVNKGVKASSAPYILILNNDVIVTPKAVELMLEALKNNSETGLAGPWQEDLMANILTELTFDNYPFPYPVFTYNVKVAVNSNELPVQENTFSLYRFADAMARKNRNMFVNSLTGHCMLLSRKIFEEVSPDGLLFDENYGFGYYEDFDLCERLKREGYNLVMATGSIVHHFGSKTFSRNKPVQDRLSKKNKRLFFSKWFPQLVTEPPLISLCMIVKDEEKNLTKCLNSINELCDEIIITDTGSTDRTVLIAQQFGAVIQYYGWNGNFAEARNFSIKQASGKWVLWLDADDFIDKEGLQKIKEFVENPEDYSVAKLPVVLQYEGYTEELYQYRLFKNNQGISFTGFIHETPVLSANHKIKELGAPVYHSGYKDTALEAEKEKRNNLIILNYLKKHPTDINAFFQLIKSYSKLADPEKVMQTSEAFLTAFEMDEKNKILFYQAYIFYSKALFSARETKKALNVAFMAVDLFPSLASAYLWLGQLFESLKLYDYAISYYQKVLALGLPTFNGKEVNIHEYRTEPSQALARINAKIS